MSQLNEPLKIEVIGNAIIVDPFVPKTIQEKKMKEQGMIVTDKLDPKNPLWEDSTQRNKVSDWDEHPFQGIVKAIGDGVPDGTIGTIKVNDRVACRIGCGEPIIFKTKVYWRVTAHEILLKYIGTER